MAAEASKILGLGPVNLLKSEGEPGSERVEIDTSAAFESVKEATNRFGGMGFWKPSSRVHASQQVDEKINIAKAEKQAELLERDLIIKERETLDVLKELETTRIIVEELKFKLQKEASETNAFAKENTRNHNNVHSVAEEAENENHESNMDVSDAPGIILLELEQAKMNLARTTTDLVDIRATVDLYNKKIERERMLLDKTRQRLSSDTSKISSLEEELDQTKQALELTKHTELQGSSPNHLDIVTRELQKLGSETEQFKEVGRAARSEVLRALSQIEQTRSGIKTAEIRLVAAKKMKKAAKASEAVALAEIRALSNGENKSNASEHKCESVTLTLEEYSSLISRAIEANEACKDEAVLDANLSKTDILNRVENVIEELKISKKTLEEALSRVEAANEGKLAVEEALRKWRSEHSQKQRSVHNSTKFKNSHRFLHRKESHLLDENGMNHGNDELKPVLKPSLSIGQILSRKLLQTKEYENGTEGEKSLRKRQVSLRHFLSKHNANPHSPVKKDGKENLELPSPRKKFSFARITILVKKQMKNKKKKSSSINLNVSQLER
ncbi:WEB family protein At2g38370-like isoform X1 [Primulina huaijiensis]|uniref:WEB family protein At2g38370-like isoform X1 n=1 Tax=Primulina huaijiensis TaxID=1492673 RepID=UPI003CC75C67